MNRSICFACLGLICGMATTSVHFGNGTSVNAQTASSGGQKKCDYTYIRDLGVPSIGKDGEIQYNETWAAVLEAGWVLKIATGQGGSYIFEKCR